MITIAISQLKGGTAKTTTAVTLSTGLARRGHKTLLIDLDPQGHVATSLGIERLPSLNRWLVGGDPLSAVMRQAEANLSVITGDHTTEQVQRHFTTLAFSETLIKRQLANTEFAFTLIDFPPSINVLTVAALVASDFVLAPTKLDPLAVEGLGQLLRAVAEVEQQGYGFSGWACLPTFFDQSTRESADSLTELVRTFGRRVWPPIPASTRVRSAPAHGMVLWDFDPKSRAIIGINGIGGYLDTLNKLEALRNGVA